jgi:RNA polymerase sigma-70 factor (ECF subfamily)
MAAESLLSTTARLRRERPMRIDEAPPDDERDALLVRRMAAGDPEAHRLLYERHAAGLLRYLRARLDGAPQAEELLQEVMVAAWRQAGAFRGDSRVRTWLFGMAHHLAAKLWRRRALESRHSGPELDDGWHAGLARSDGRMDRVDERIDLEGALRLLPWEQRAVLDLILVHGLPEAEAAAILGIAVGTVKSRLHRAKAALRGHLRSGIKDINHA